MKRQDAMRAFCPKCGVPPTVRCSGKRGDARSSVHRERLNAQRVVRALGGPLGEFYRSDEWRRLRYKALVKSKGCCRCCGSRPTFDSPLHVDHIKPRSLFPELALVLSNLQVLCADCNLGKGNSDTTDWRAA